MKNKRVLNSIHKKLKQRKKKYSKSILATNKLHANSDIFRTSYLFKQPGKRRIYNPNAKYFKDGGPHEIFLSTGKFRPQTTTIGSTLGYKQVFPKRETTWSLTGNVGYGKNLDTNQEGLAASVNAENFGKFFDGQRRLNAVTNLEAFVEPGNYGAQLSAGPNLHWGSHPKRTLPRGTGRVDFQPFNLRLGYQSTPWADDSGDALFQGSTGRLGWGYGARLKGEYALPKKGALRSSKINPVLFGDAGVDLDFLVSDYNKQGVEQGSISGGHEGFRVNPSFSANVGIRLPIDRINLRRRPKPSLVEDDPYYNPGIRVSNPEAVEAYEEPDEYQDGGPHDPLPAEYLKSEGFAKAANQDLDSLLRGFNTDGYDSHWYEGGTENYGVTSDQLRAFAGDYHPKSFVNAAAYSQAMNKLANDAGGKNVINIPFADNPIVMRTADDDVEYVEYEKPTTLQEEGYMDETGTNAVNQYQSRGLAKRYTQFKDGGIPKVKHGGPHGGPGNPPTQADSLRVYNNALKLQNFYDSMVGTELWNDPRDGTSLDDFIYDMESFARNDIIKEHLEHHDVSPANKALIRRNTDPNITYMSDYITGAIDPRAPLAIYDRRIKPQGIKNYEPYADYLEQNFLVTKVFDNDHGAYGDFINKWNDYHNETRAIFNPPNPRESNYNKKFDDYLTKRRNLAFIKAKSEIDPSKLQEYNYFLKELRKTNEGDAPGVITTIPYYEPIMVKPWSMLTEEEKEYRRKFKPKPKGTLDPKKSVNVNLIKLGLATDTKSANVVKKELYAKLFPDEEYKGKADQNTKLNKYIFDNNLATEDIEEIINPSILPPPAPPQYEIEPVAVEPEISPLPIIPPVLPSDLGDVEIIGDDEIIDDAEDSIEYDRKFGVWLQDKAQKDAKLKTLLKYKIPEFFNPKKSRISQYYRTPKKLRAGFYNVPIEEEQEEQLYPEGFVPRFEHGGPVELGDEVDEATMKRLKKLGYTFEEI